MSRRSKARKRHAKQAHRRAQHVALADLARVEAPEPTLERITLRTGDVVELMSDDAMKDFLQKQGLI